MSLCEMHFILYNTQMCSMSTNNTTHMMRQKREANSAEIRLGRERMKAKMCHNYIGCFQSHKK